MGHPQSAPVLSTLIVLESAAMTPLVIKASITTTTSVPYVLEEPLANGRDGL